MPLVTRTGKGSQLTTAEMDANLTYLESLNAALPPVAITADTTLTASAHANRLLLCNSASPITLTINSDASGWANDDSINAVRLGAGIVTLTGGTATFPDVGGTLKAAAGVNRFVGATRVGTSTWIPTELNASVATSSSVRSLANGANFFKIPQRSGTTAFDGAGWAQPTNLVNGTLVARSFSSSSAFAARQRVGFVATSAANPNEFSYRPNEATLSFSDAPIVSEFVFGVSDAIASGARSFVGFIVVTGTLTTVETTSTTLQSRIGMGHDSADSQFKIIHSDSSGVCTTVAINGGTGFPCNTNAADLYSLRITYFPSTDVGGRRLEWVAKNLSTNLTGSGTITTNLPTSTQATNTAVQRASGNNAISAGMDFGGVVGGVYA